MVSNVVPWKYWFSPGQLRVCHAGARMVVLLVKGERERKSTGKERPLVASPLKFCCRVPARGETMWERRVVDVER